MSNLVNCKACGKEIAKGVAKCVHCGKDQRNFFMKHKIMTGILVLIIIGAINSAANGGKSDSANKTNEPSTAAAVKTTPDTSKPEVKEFYAVNEDVQLNDAVVKVTNIEKSNGSSFDKPKDGMEFVIVSVTIKNSGKNEISYNPFDFKMQNSKGQITDKTFTTVDSKTSLSSGKLAAGGEVSGTITFEQPKDDSALVLKYKGNMFSNKEIKIKLN